MPETVLRILLFGFVSITITAYLFFWIRAYQEVPRREEWSQQASALQPWWFLDKKLLPKDQDHLRIKAMVCFFLAVGVSLIWMVA